jgi:hypothetical protein
MAKPIAEELLGWQYNLKNKNPYPYVFSPPE